MNNRLVNIFLFCMLLITGTNALCWGSCATGSCSGLGTCTGHGFSGGSPFYVNHGMLYGGTTPPMNPWKMEHPVNTMYNRIGEPTGTLHLGKFF